MTARPVESLVSPFGVIGRVGALTGPRGAGRLRCYAAQLGSGHPGRGQRKDDPVSTGGRVLDDDAMARLVAMAEGAERYAGMGLYETPVRATMAELDGPVADLSAVPRCTAQEYARPGCPVMPFDEPAPLRWVQGLDLRTSQPTWIPAVMVCYGLPDLAPGERFWYRISTGHAVHTDPREALVRAVCEVIERDSNAILWLQRLPLPPVSERLFTARSQYLIDWARQHFIDTYVFDSTTDLGVPTAYCLQVAEHDRLGRQVVGAATGASLSAAVEKALIDVASIRALFYKPSPIPADYKDFELFDGARYMGLPGQAGAFDFLTDGLAARPASEGGPGLPADPGAALRGLADRLADAGCQVIVADRTTRELADVGLTAVVAVIPGLQPMSLDPLAQFRAHPRLYAAPGRMGYRCLAEEELNPWPQPFA